MGGAVRRHGYLHRCSSWPVLVALCHLDAEVQEPTREETATAAASTFEAEAWLYCLEPNRQHLQCTNPRLPGLVLKLSTSGIAPSRWGCGPPMAAFGALGGTTLPGATGREPWTVLRLPLEMWIEWHNLDQCSFLWFWCGSCVRISIMEPQKELHWKVQAGCRQDWTHGQLYWKVFVKLVQRFGLL